MIKPTPNPPEAEGVSPYASRDSKKLHEAADRALDHYLNPPTTGHRPNSIFMVAPDVDSETLLAHACESLASANVMAGNLAFDLDGPTRNTALAIQQIISLAELAVNRVLDRFDVPPSQA